MLRPLLSRRGVGVAVKVNDAQKSVPNERASTINIRKSETISVDDSSISHTSRPKSVTPSVRKLRKKPPPRDGYESAGGHVSEKKATKKEKSGDAMDAKVKKKKSFIQVINKFSNDVQSPSSQGYETDGGAVLSSRKSVKIKKKSNTDDPSKETGYDTDGGYQSENRKSKTRFFKLSSKSSKPDFHAVANGPVPALPNSVAKSVVPLPIAGKFARTRTFSFSMSSPTTTESAEIHVDNSFPQISFRPFPAINDFASTTSSSSPVSAPSSTFDRAQIAPMSDSPSAFNAHLLPRSRDSRFSSTSSSGSGSNQHHKSQNKGHFSPVNSPPSSIQGHQLRPSLSLSSINRPKPVISLPITRDTAPTSTNPPLSSTRSLHSLSVSPTSTSVSSSVSSPQSKKPFRVKIHHPDLPTQLPSPAQTVLSPSGPETTPALPLIQIPKFTKVRPKNPPTDGFGPRTPDSGALGSTFRPSPISSPIFSPSFSPLSPNLHIQESSKRSSQQTIIPSTDYIVPSPRDSPLKSQFSGLPSPPVLTYHIPPPPSPAPRGPLPTPPSSCESGESGSASSNCSSSGSAGQHQPFAVHLRQKMSRTNMKQSILPPQSTTVASQPVGVGGGLGIEKTVVVGLRIEKKIGIGSSANEVPNFQKERLKEAASLSRFAADNRQSWIDPEGDSSFDDTLEVEHDHQELEEPEDLYEILDRFDSRDNENHHSNSSEQALERSHSFKAGKLTKKKRYHYPDNNSFDERSPPPSQYVPAAIAVPDLYGFEDDGKSVGDRTSRWTESLYSRSSSGHGSILDEEESEERRGLLLRRVEAMLDAERSRLQEAYIPPLPEIPQAYANIMHKQNGNNDYAGHRSNSITPGRSWHKS